MCSLIRSKILKLLFDHISFVAIEVMWKVQAIWILSFIPAEVMWKMFSKQIPGYLDFSLENSICKWVKSSELKTGMFSTIWMCLKNYIEKERSQHFALFI